nr:MAG TPA: regulatory protein [Caudoviricetes sp.]
MNSLEVFNQPMMTSVMLAELVEKEHKNVLVDVRKLVEFYTQTYSAEK